MKRITLLIGLILILLGSILAIVLLNRHNPNDVYRKEEVLDFIASHELFEKSENPKMLFFLLNSCGPCSEELLKNFISLSSDEIVKNKEIVIICSETSYEVLMQLEELHNIKINVFKQAELERAGFLVYDDFLYIFDNKMRLKDFYWLGSLTFPELSNTLEKVE